jgi:haloalkane dehalogenase
VLQYAIQHISLQISKLQFDREAAMKVLRTPDSCFDNLTGYPFEPNFLTISDPQLGEIRIHYLDEGPANGPTVLCLHGEPSWCYLYRKMIPLLVEGGFRVLAPDLVGFGRSDKPENKTDYSYARHVGWMTAWFDSLELNHVTLLAQDWGGLIGLRMVADMPDRFSRISLANTGLPTGDQQMPEAFLKWRAWSQTAEDFDTGLICNDFGRGQLSADEMAAYRAPFPDDRYKAGARQFPSLVPASPDDPAADANRSAWQQLMQWQKPMLLCFSDGDPITSGADQPFLKLVPGARNQPHITLKGSHFIQEQDGETWARAVVNWMNPA